MEEEELQQALDDVLEEDAFEVQRRRLQEKIYDEIEAAISGSLVSEIKGVIG